MISILLPAKVSSRITCELKEIEKSCGFSHLRDQDIYVYSAVQNIHSAASYDIAAEPTLNECTKKHCIAVYVRYELGIEMILLDLDL